MKSYYQLLLSFSLCFICYSQEVPEINIASPTAFEFTKYGDISTNENTGKINAAIPLCVLESGNLQLPISLSYTGAGVKVDQMSSWTGINWNLNAGGVITRIVKDEPDENFVSEINSSRRILYSANDLNNMDLSVGSQDSQHLNIIETGYYDTQADQFNFSFLNYSGSFFLDEDFNVHLANSSEPMKIEFVGGVQYSNVQDIIITTKDGVKYYFGGQYCEQTRTRNSVNITATEYYTTSYYLYLIQHPFLDTISFEYLTEASDNYDIKIGESESKEVITGGNAGRLCGDVNLSNNGYNYSETYNKIYDGKYLRRIYASRTNQEIIFHSTEENVFGHYKRKLESIEVNDSFVPENEKKFTFQYTMAPSRFFLDKVSFLNRNDQFLYDYKLEYDNPLGLPDRFSKAKDHLGYYNGKTTNTTLLPQNDDYHLSNAMGGNLANKDADINYAKKGSLVKIEYPTGGFTEYEYEGNKIKIDTYKNINLKVYNDLSTMYPNAYPIPDTKLSHTEILVGDFPNFDMAKTHSALIKINATAQGNINHHYKVRVIIDDLSNQTQTVKEYFLEHDVYNYSWAFETTFFKDRSYRVTLELETDPQSSNSYPVDVNLNFSHINGSSIEEGLGVRIKNVKNYTETNVLSNTQRYYYNTIDKVFDTDAIPSPINYWSTYITNRHLVICCSFVGDLGTFSDFPIYDTYNAKKLSSETLYSLFPSSDGPIHQYVTTSFGGDNFEGGGVEKKFLNRLKVGTLSYSLGNDLPSAQIYETNKSNQDIFNGKVVEEKSILNKNESLYINQVTKNNYVVPTPFHIDNMVLQRAYDVCELQESNLNSLSGVYIGFYKTYENELQLESSEFTTYVDPVPLTDFENENNYDKVVATTSYEYESYVGQPTKITTTTSNSDVVLETKNYYVDQITQLSGLTTDQENAYNTLKTMHRLSDILQSENYQIRSNSTSELISTQRTLYRNWNGGGLVLPEIIKVSKSGNTLTNRVRFYDYTIYGDLLQVSREGGNLVRYVYDPNSHVIRKIENYDTSMNEPHYGTNSSSLCYHQNQHSNSMVTLYNYIGDSGLIESIVDPKCQKTTYEYDSFNRLEYIKDSDGNILNKKEYNYKQ
ncbi:hypothetical protein [uncultured Algibacter sp.]|uniref:hypothetical protein n=1 Tax=uncultured Algibacter sp. TaxID=298659 RepID=UPI00262F07EB|nr:hypothetical protein [uncultured Algibacter sp.]